MKTYLIRSTPLDPGVENRFKEFEDIMSKYAKSRAIQAADLQNLDAEVNGGALVEVARILGKPLYMRVNHHDPEYAKHELAEMRSLVKDVVWPSDDYEDEEYNLYTASRLIGLSVVTLRRYIKDGRLQARKLGKNYIVTKQSLDKLKENK